MSDKPLPITLTGTYKGYQVAVQVEATLDSLDKLVNRLQARGIEPLPAPTSGSKGSKPLETRTGIASNFSDVKQQADGKRRPVLRFTLTEAEGGCTVSVWEHKTATELRQQIKPGDSITVEGYTSVRDDWVNFSLKGWQKAAA